MPVVAVADSHALIWAATGRLRKLGREARRMFQRADAGRAAIYVPTLVLIEVSEAARARAISLGMAFEEWMDALLSSGNYHAVDLSVPIVRRAEELHGIPERGDRLIAATAAELECPLITRDEAITRVAAVEHLW